MGLRQAAIYWDDDLRAQANASGANYWHTYTAEICDQMGLKAIRLRRSQLRPEALADLAVLILPDLAAQYLKPDEKTALRGWVAGGGLLVGFATGGLGELFGVVVDDELPQPEDAFTLVAALRFADGEIARPLLPEGEEDTPLPVAAPVQLLRAGDDCRELARLLGLSGRDLRRPAITLRAVGKGLALYFGFDLAHCVWAMHHGRPILDDFDGDGKLRSSDAMILRPFPTALPYADLLVMLLRQVIARQGVPLLYPLPPTAEGEVPEALFHWGGDDEGAAGQQVPASDFMAELGLPYHLNIMPDPAGEFAFSAEEFAHFKANGHEPSLHFNFIDGCQHPYSFTRQDLQRQVEWYRQAYGETPVCTVFHWTTWTLWSEPAAWLASLGVLADNSRFHQPSPPINPINVVGFGFGTSYPYHFYHDWRRDNDQIRFLALPITAYEPGYWRDTEVLDTAPFRRAIELAARWHLTMNLFFHSVCIYNYPQCREAIKWGVAHMRERGLTVVHMGNDDLARWWLVRSEARVEEARWEAGALRCKVSCRWASGCVLQVPWESATGRVTIGEAVRVVEAQEECGTRWLRFAVPAGAHEVVVSSE